MPTPFVPVKDRLLAKISINKVTGCWDWTASKNWRGYGQMKAYGTMRGSHRISYIEFRGEIPAGMNVCHKCDNPGCINPDHLFLGTQADNIADMVSKDRHARGAVVSHVGVDNFKAKLTESDVIAIRAADDLTNMALAKRFGVSNVQIRNIRKRKSWSHVLASPSSPSTSNF